VLSIVVPIFNEQENLPELARRLRGAAEDSGEDWEIVFVDDGSRDASPSILSGLAAADGRFKVLTLSRNFGHQPAVTAGLDAASGDAVVLIDGDLQDPPEVIPQMVEAWRAGAEVVTAERAKRDDAGWRSPVRGLGFKLFYPWFRRFSDLPDAPDAGIFGLMDRRVVDHLKQLPERSRFIPGLRSWLGFRTAAVPYERADRAAGKPKQNLPRLIKYAADATISFSTKPLRLATWSGFAVSGLSLWMAVYYIFSYFINDKKADGFTTTIAVIFFLGGVQLITVGILGEYIGRIYDEVKQRPLYIVRDQQGFTPRKAKPPVRRQVKTPSSAAPNPTAR
jgi:dolichol-phosphate mannosyltransferase